MIDIHTHVVPMGFPPNPLLGRDAQWPCMRCGGADLREVVIDGKRFRSVGANAWDPARRLQEMEVEGIAAQTLSPMPELLSYWLEPDQTTALAKHVNAYIASMTAQAPSKFFGLGMVTLQQPEMAAKQVGQLKSEFELKGVEVGTNINGVPIGDPRFDPFYQALIEENMCLFVHALHPAKDRLCGPALMEALVAFPCEVSFAISSFMVHGVLRKFPALRVAFSHGGGAFPFMLGRVQHGWEVSEDLQAAFDSPQDLISRIYVDTLVYSAISLASLDKTFGTERLLIGSDFPFLIRQRNPADVLHTLGASAARTIGVTNARRFLGLD